MAVTFAGKSCLDPALLHRECLDRGLPVEPWFGRANSFRCPLGPDSGVGWVLMRRQDVDALPPRLGIATPSNYTPLVFDDGTNKVPLPAVQWVGARCVTPGYKSDPDSAFLVELCDPRKWMGQDRTLGVGNNGINLRLDNGEKYPATRSDMSWSAAASGIWSGAFLMHQYNPFYNNNIFPGLPFTPQGVPESFIYRQDSGWPSWKALTHFLDRLGCRLRYDPIADKFGIVRIGMADSAADSAVAAIASSLLWSDYPAGYVPPLETNIWVLFESMEEYGGYRLEDTQVDSNFIAAAGISGCRGEVIYDDMPYFENNSRSDAYNRTDINARKAERAADYARIMQLQPQANVYEGIQPKVVSALGSQWSEIAFSDRGDGAKTELARHAWNPFRDWRPARKDSTYARRPYVWSVSTTTTGLTGPAGMTKLSDVLTNNHSWNMVLRCRFGFSCYYSGGTGGTTLTYGVYRVDAGGNLITPTQVIYQDSITINQGITELVSRYYEASAGLMGSSMDSPTRLAIFANAGGGTATNIVASLNADWVFNFGAGP